PSTGSSILTTSRCFASSCATATTSRKSRSPGTTSSARRPSEASRFRSRSCGCPRSGRRSALGRAADEGDRYAPGVKSPAPKTDAVTVEVLDALASVARADWDALLPDVTDPLAGGAIPFLEWDFLQA